MVPALVILELAVSPVQSFACARYSNGEVWCAGEGSVGQLGTGQDALTDPAYDFGKLLPPRPALIRDATKVVAGIHTACAMARRGVYCWGLGGNGELGWGLFRADPAPQPVIGAVEPIDLAMGDSHACLITKAGGVQCWGKDASGEKRHTPADVPGVKAAKQLALGSHHSCALDAKGAVWCWGAAPPAQVKGLGKVDGISAAGDVTCARVGKATKCWGGEKLPPPVCALGPDKKAHCADGSKLEAVVEKL